MRVLFVLHHPTFGGPHNQALQLSTRLRESGWDMTVVIPDEPGNAFARLAEGGVRTIRVPLHRLRALWNPIVQIRFAFSLLPEILALRSLMRANRIDLVLLAGLANPHAAFAAKLCGLPVVWQLVDTRTPWPARHFLSWLVLRLADSIMSTGRAVAEAHPGISSDLRLVTFFPPVDVVRFAANPNVRRQARDELRFKETDMVVGTIGNLNPQKGHLTFVAAAARLRETQPNARFVILGASYPQHAAYLKRVVEAGRVRGLRLGTEFQIVDAGGRVAELAQAIDVFWMTSEPRSEGMPTAIQEAMALDLPAISTDVGSVREQIDDGVSGLLVRPHDANALVAKTELLLGDADRRAQLVRAARVRAVEDFAIEPCVRAHVVAFEAAIRRRAGTAAFGPHPSVSLSSLKRLLVCPICLGALDWDSAQRVVCSGGHSFPIDDGIPVLLRDLSAAQHDELSHAAIHKSAQASFFDAERDGEFETRRPEGAPRLYRWLISRKFDYATRGLGDLVGKSCLVVCGGSGMDAEFLTRRGARVVTADISLGAAKRAARRAAMHGVAYLAIVADVERLPISDASIDVAFVHDGLHHLGEPHIGLTEMARVARAVSINEPARAAATALAVRLRLARNREDAGNLVFRFTIDEILKALARRRFRPRFATRYAMYYPHRPGRVMSILSTPLLASVVERALMGADALIGRFGNKLSVQAERLDASDPARALSSSTASPSE